MTTHDEAKREAIEKTKAMIDKFPLPAEQKAIVKAMFESQASKIMYKMNKDKAKNDPKKCKDKAKV